MTLRQRINGLPIEGSRRPTVPHGDIAVAMIGLLCLGKSDFADIEPFRRESFCGDSLALPQLPFEETIRQQLDLLGTSPVAILHEDSAAMLQRHVGMLTPCHRDWVPLDVDVSPFNKSGTKREGVAYTFKRHEDCAPIFPFLGQDDT